MKIAVVGQGYVGKAYSDWFESRGSQVIRYALEPPHSNNRDRVAEAEMVVIAVPTPTVAHKQDVRAVFAAAELAASDATVLIKSTVLPGTTDRLAKVRTGPTFHVPEFLRAQWAAGDLADPHRVVIGIPEGGSREVARKVLRLLPAAPEVHLVSAKLAEFAKYAANAMLTAKLVMANALYDICPETASWGAVARVLSADPRIGPDMLTPVLNGHRGAGGHCLPKDLDALLGWETTDSTFLNDLWLENERLLGILPAAKNEAA